MTAEEPNLSRTAHNQPRLTDIHRATHSKERTYQEARRVDGIRILANLGHYSCSSATLHLFRAATRCGMAAALTAPP